MPGFRIARLKPYAYGCIVSYVHTHMLTNTYGTMRV
jgi:hypothetical protein